MRCLITGVGGFVGRHLAALLVRETDWKIFGIEARNGVEVQGVEISRCDLLDLESVMRVVADQRPDVIFHLAAQAYVPTSVAAPSETLVNNTVAQINLFEACRTAGIDPVILVVGSSEVYGAVEPDESPLSERQPFRPVNPYAVSKVAQDMLGLQYFLSYGLRVVRVRPFNHIGPGQSDRFAVASFARQIAEAEAGRSEPVIRVGNLAAQRDFLDVRDVVRAYHLLMRPEFAGQVFNIASGVPRSVQEILDRLLRLTRLRMQVVEDQTRMRPSDVAIMYGDAGTLMVRTGWKPLISIDQSLEDLLNDWRARIAEER